jgi:predicted DNA-binding WGR domain protein
VAPLDKPDEKRGDAVIPAVGWEMRFTDPAKDSDKFYRIIVSSSTLILNWGKYRHTGQFQVHRFDSINDAQERALAITSDKEKRGGYRELRPVTDFHIDEKDLTSCHIDGQPRPVTVPCIHIAKRFTDAAAELPWQH